ncbi:MAG: TetR/AcrR family transcriptional regulator [Acholeplasmataceae bacterium]|nr:TetR/AcrR family transcriptional regulator [Acholeplasmataceae bacterium]
MRQKQIDESVQMILDGFFNLLSKSDYHSINMSSIALEAQVSRMTLYRYFKDKEDIIIYYIQETMKRFKHMISNQPSPNFVYILQMRNQLIYEDARLRTAFNHEIVESLFREVIKQSEPLINSFIPNVSLVSKYKKLFVAGGISNITRDWVLNGMKETPEQITRECLKLLLLLNE